MSRVIKFRNMAEIEEEAAAWVWRLDEENTSAAQRKAFEDWVRRDPRNRQAFEELGGVWSALDGLAQAKQAEKIATFSQLPAAPAQAVGHMNRWKLAGYAAAATLLICTAAFFWTQRSNEVQALATAVGQQRTVTLADGSAVSLNTNTILETHFDRERRIVRLLKGEALFKVTRDKERPFFVYAGDAVVRAIGTEFNVRMREGREVQVIVAEGAVEVESGATSATAQRFKRALSAGQRIDTSESAPVSSLDPEMLSKILAWREGAIVLDGESLSEAIVELNRYTDIRFIVTDPRVREMKVGGRFKAGDIDEFLQALKKALPVTTQRTADNLVYIEFQPERSH